MLERQDFCSCVNPAGVVVVVPYTISATRELVCSVIVIYCLLSDYCLLFSFTKMMSINANIRTITI